MTHLFYSKDEFEELFPSDQSGRTRLHNPKLKYPGVVLIFPRRSGYELVVGFYEDHQFYPCKTLKISTESKRKTERKIKNVTAQLENWYEEYVFRALRSRLHNIGTKVKHLGEEVETWAWEKNK